MTRRAPPFHCTFMAATLLPGSLTNASTDGERPHAISKDQSTTKPQGSNMSQSTAQVPPEVARYLKGPAAESRQFDFLIGNWDVAATQFKDDGSVLLRYQARWVAQLLSEGRMVMDEFKALAPTGQQISSYVTLRTYSDVTQRWEMTGLAALQPAMSGEWSGIWTDGEMLLDAVGMNADGKRVRTKIRFFNIEPQRFAWESQSSLDDGKTWLLTASLVATRGSIGS